MVRFGGDDHGAIFGNGDHLLEVGARLSVARAYQPPILALKHFSGAHVDHGLNGQHHANLQLHSQVPMSVVGNVGLFVHISAHAMANIFANYAIDCTA